MANKAKPKPIAKMVIDSITADESVEVSTSVDYPYPIMSESVEGTDTEESTVIVKAPTVILKEDLVVEVPVEKNVKVRLAEKHSCTIGGERYVFEKGKVYTVPVNVKSILSRVGLLTAL